MKVSDYHKTNKKKDMIIIIIQICFEIAYKNQRKCVRDRRIIKKERRNWKDKERRREREIDKA